MRSLRNKFDEFRCQILSLGADIAICTETWLASNDVNEAYEIQGYNCHRGDRIDDSGHGGVALYSKKKLSAQEIFLPDFKCFEICAVRLSFPNVIVVGMYLRPGVDVISFDAFCQTFIKTVDDILGQLPFHNLIVAGDFNQYDRSFLTSHLSLFNIVFGPTRANAHLDQIYVDSRFRELHDPKNVTIGPPVGSSDHRSVFVASTSSTKGRVITKHTLFDLRLSYVLAFEQRFLSHDLDSFFSCKDLEQKCAMFYEFLTDAMKEIPRKEVFLKSDDAPWMTPFIKFLIDRRWMSYRSRNWVAYNYLKMKVNKEIWRAKKSFFLKKSKSVKGLWSYVNMERGSKKRDCSGLISEFVSVDALLNTLNDNFCRAMNTSNYSSSSLSATYPDDAWSLPIEVTEVWQCLHRLPLKATGSDGVPTKLYKTAALILAEPICSLINECIRQRKFPSIWKIADVIPVPKSRGASPDDYRPISLLPVPAKIAEKLILRSLRFDMTSHLGDNQFGIRKNSSTTHAIIAAHDALTRHADDSNVGASILIAFDFSKAFDKIDHQKLLLKVSDMEFPRGFVRLLMDYLRGRQQRVRLNGIRSDLKLVTSGVPQGSLLGPYLFGLFISSLQPLWPSTTMVKYVDDVSFVTSFRKTSVSHDLDRAREEIENIVQWSCVNNLTLNASKTSGMIYSRCNFSEIHNLESSFTDVNFMNSVRFLGVILDNNLGWNSHVNFIVKKCAQRLYILRRIRSVTTKEDFFTIYCSIVRNLLEYASPVFVGTSCLNASRLQKFQNRCLRIKGIHEAPDLASRRRSAAATLFDHLRSVDTFLKDSLPDLLPSGRPSVPFCRTSLRRSSFIPAMSIAASSTHFD